MTSDEFKAKVKELFQQVENKEDIEILFMAVSFDKDNKPIDIEILATGCIVCHFKTLDLYIEQEGIVHKSNGTTQVH